MKHTSQIQIEFIKHARTTHDWQSLSPEAQLRYLRQHPNSQKHQTFKTLSPEAQLEYLQRTYDLEVPKKIKYKGKTFFSADSIINLLNKLGEKILGEGPVLDQPRDPLVAKVTSPKH